ncbi:MAG TPA: ChaN family lipoprotein [Polyangiales bacterium]|nr:ChaN family lipoprotein [Polyangiales bacterium]
MRPLHRLVLCSVLAAAGCATTTPGLRPAGGFTQALGRDHPLVGRVYDVARARWIDGADLARALEAADFAVLGETHDNRDQHLLQAQLVERFARAHPNASVAFEMLDETQAAALEGKPPATPEALAERVAWQDTGWPDFALYRPVFAAALAAKLQIVAAHPSREHVRASMHGLEPDEARALYLDEPLPEAQAAAQRDEIRESHCGQAPDAMVAAMQAAQSYKDAFMARALRSAGSPALLIAGRGHARNDRGVPFYLRRAGAGSILSVAFVDLSDDRKRPTDYDLRAFDYAVFTPRASDQDPCERFKQQLEHMKRPAASDSTLRRSGA